MRSLALTLTIFSISSASFACEKAETTFEDKTVVVCYDQKADSYLSESCKDVEKCFFDKKIELTYYANQSPGFSLCYQIKGKPFFAHIKGKKDTVPLCAKNSYFVDQETLMLTYKKIK